MRDTKPNPPRPWIYIASDRLGIVDAPDFYEAQFKLEGWIDLDTLLWLGEADKLDVELVRQRGGLLPLKYREPQPTKE